MSSSYPKYRNSSTTNKPWSRGWATPKPKPKVDMDIFSLPGMPQMKFNLSSRNAVIISSPFFTKYIEKNHDRLVGNLKDRCQEKMQECGLMADHMGQGDGPVTYNILAMQKNQQEIDRFLREGGPLPKLIDKPRNVEVKASSSQQDHPIGKGGFLPKFIDNPRKAEEVTAAYKEEWRKRPPRQFVSHCRERSAVTGSRNYGRTFSSPVKKKWAMTPVVSAQKEEELKRKVQGGGRQWGNFTPPQPTVQAQKKSMEEEKKNEVKKVPCQPKTSVETKILGPTTSSVATSPFTSTTDTSQTDTLTENTVTSTLVDGGGSKEVETVEEKNETEVEVRDPSRACSPLSTSSSSSSSSSELSPSSRACPSTMPDVVLSSGTSSGGAPNADNLENAIFPSPPTSDIAGQQWKCSINFLNIFSPQVSSTANDNKRPSSQKRLAFDSPAPAKCKDELSSSCSSSSDDDDRPPDRAKLTMVPFENINRRRCYYRTVKEYVRMPDQEPFSANERHKGIMGPTECEEIVDALPFDSAYVSSFVASTLPQSRPGRSRRRMSRMAPRRVYLSVPPNLDRIPMDKPKKTSPLAPTNPPYNETLQAAALDCRLNRIRVKGSDVQFCPAQPLPKADKAILIKVVRCGGPNDLRVVVPINWETMRQRLRDELGAKMTPYDFADPFTPMLVVKMPTGSYMWMRAFKLALHGDTVDVNLLDSDEIMSVPRSRVYRCPKPFSEVPPLCVQARFVHSITEERWKRFTAMAINQAPVRVVRVSEDNIRDEFVMELSLLKYPPKPNPEELFCSVECGGACMARKEASAKKKIPSRPHTPIQFDYHATNY